MNSKVISFLCCFLIPFVFIAACSSQPKPVEQSMENTEDKNSVVTFTFTGESEHWKAVFVENIKDDDDVNKKITLTYKDSDIKSVGRVKSSFIYPSGKMTEDGILGSDGTIALQSFGTNVAHNSKDSVVKATVEWNGKTETFEMTGK